jgi:hypothetical protein
MNGIRIYEQNLSHHKGECYNTQVDVATELRIKLVISRASRNTAMLIPINFMFTVIL